MNEQFIVRIISTSKGREYTTYYEKTVDSPFGKMPICTHAKADAHKFNSRGEAQAIIRWLGRTAKIEAL